MTTQKKTHIHKYKHTYTYTQQYTYTDTHIHSQYVHLISSIIFIDTKDIELLRRILCHTSRCRGTGDTSDLTPLSPRRRITFYILSHSRSLSAIARISSIDKIEIRRGMIIQHFHIEFVTEFNEALTFLTNTLLASRAHVTALVHFLHYTGMSSRQHPCLVFFFKKRQAPKNPPDR